MESMKDDIYNLLWTMGASFLLVGALFASIVAGFGEELSIHGVLQPRFGILIPSLLFAALHAFQ